MRDFTEKCCAPGTGQPFCGSHRTTSADTSRTKTCQLGSALKCICKGKPNVVRLRTQRKSLELEVIKEQTRKAAGHLLPETWSQLWFNAYSYKPGREVRILNPGLAWYISAMMMMMIEGYRWSKWCWEEVQIADVFELKLAAVVGSWAKSEQNWPSACCGPCRVLRPTSVKMRQASKLTQRVLRPMPPLSSRRSTPLQTVRR